MANSISWYIIQIELCNFALTNKEHSVDHPIESLQYFFRSAVCYRALCGMFVHSHTNYIFKLPRFAEPGEKH